MIPNSLVTDRLSLTLFTPYNTAFILELLNTPGWLKFIGDRKVRNIADAEAYIGRINENINTTYFVVIERQENAEIGIISFIKRDYLDAHDIGFAFLPKYNKQGYAFEAATAVLTALSNDPAMNHILATTIPDNISSISLLQKLGFSFWKEIHVDNQDLSIYKLILSEYKQSK